MRAKGSSDLRWATVSLAAGLLLPGTLFAEGQKRLLAVGMSADWQHESVSDALATLYDLGRESGLWRTHIRTDVEPITKRVLGRNGKNLDHFDAVFFVTSGELPLDEEQKADLLSFVRDDGKGFLGAHSAIDTLDSWPGYGDMIGGRFDGHPWNEIEVEVRVEDHEFPATRHLPAAFRILDEIYQVREFSPRRVRVLMRLETTGLDLTREGVHARDFPIAWAREYGAGRVFYSALGHRPEIWDREDIRSMWLGAVQWALGLTGESLEPPG